MSNSAYYVCSDNKGIVYMLDDLMYCVKDVGNNPEPVLLKTASVIFKRMYGGVLYPNDHVALWSKNVSIFADHHLDYVYYEKNGELWVIDTKDKRTDKIADGVNAFIQMEEGTDILYYIENNNTLCMVRAGVKSELLKGEALIPGTTTNGLGKEILMVDMIEGTVNNVNVYLIKDGKVKLLLEIIKERLLFQQTFLNNVFDLKPLVAICV